MILGSTINDVVFRGGGDVWPITAKNDEKERVFFNQNGVVFLDFKQNLIKKSFWLGTSINDALLRSFFNSSHLLDPNNLHYF